MGYYNYGYRRQGFLEGIVDNIPEPIKEALVWLFAATIFGLAVYLASLAGGKLTKVVTYNPGFWVVIVLGVFFGLYRKLSNPIHYTWRELPIQLVASFVVIVGLYSVFFVTTTNIWDKETRNGFVTKAEYWEEWTEKVPCSHTKHCTRSDGKGGTETYDCGTEHAYDEQYHPPEWILKRVNIDDVHVSKEVYKNYVSLWQNQTFVDVSRLSQLSYGDGNMYYSAYPNNPKVYVPSSQEYSYVNYLRASQETVKRRFSSVESYKEYERPYPRVYQSNLGPIEIDRVISAGVNIPQGWSVVLDKELDTTLSTQGIRKQVNVLFYLIGSSDIAAGMAIEEAWIKGKKNDVIVFVGMRNFPTIEWVHVSAWTENEEFKIALRNKIKEMRKEDFLDARKVAKAITDQIELPAPSGGFERMPMEKLEYLIGDIKLPLWSQILIIVLAGMANWFMSVYLIRERVL